MTIDRWLLLHHPRRDERDRIRESIDWGGKFPFHCRLPNLDLFCSSDGAVLLLPGERGAVVGNLFPRHGPPRRITTDDIADLEAIAGGGLRTLVERYWGGYIAVLVDGNDVIIARDPIGSMPCYMSSEIPLLAAASDITSLVECGLIRPAIAWPEIPRYLAAKDLPCTATAIEGVVELLSGTMIRLSREERSTEAFWSPWDHVQADAEWSPAASADRARRAIGSAVGCWASCSETALLLVSGGLDSSVVAASARQSDARLFCMTMVTDDPAGDERGFARILAAAIGAPLEERQYRFEDVDFGESVSAHLPKPIGVAHETALYAAIVREAGQCGADAVMTGNGGDNVFYNSASIRPVIDRLIAEGPVPALLATVRDVASVTGATPWEVMRSAAEFWPRRRSPYKWLRQLDFIAPDLAAEIARTDWTHPWLDGPAEALPGKRGHIAMLLRMQNHIEGYLRAYDLPVLDPLVAQPVVELGLCIPTWRALEGGYSRTIVRRAFARDLPPAILDRKGKGSPGGFAFSAIERRVEEVRQRLLDGQLAQRGYIDRFAIERALKSGPALGQGYRQLLAFLDAEAWISTWQDRSKRR